MKDHLGNTIEEHDIVAYASPGKYGHGCAIKTGVVTGFTPQYVYIDGQRKMPGKVISLCAQKRKEGGC